MLDPVGAGPLPHLNHPCLPPSLPTFKKIKFIILSHFKVRKFQKKFLEPNILISQLKKFLDQIVTNLDLDLVMTRVWKITLHLPPGQKPQEIILDKLDRIHSNTTELPRFSFPNVPELCQDLVPPILGESFPGRQSQMILE